MAGPPTRREEDMPAVRLFLVCIHRNVVVSFCVPALNLPKILRDSCEFRVAFTSETSTNNCLPHACNIGSLCVRVCVYCNFSAMKTINFCR